MKILIRLTIPMLILLAGLHPAAAQSTKFTYQGHFNDGGAPANGSYDLTFSLFNVSVGGIAVAGPLTNSPVAVSNGLFTAAIDFGAGIFDGTTYWLQIAARTNGGGAFEELAPRQELTPTPYAIYARGADAAGLNGIIPSASLDGSYGNPLKFNNPANIFGGDGSGLTGLNASELTLGTVADTLLSANVALLNANQTFTGLNRFSDNISLLDATKSITFPATGGPNAPMMYMFASGTVNADRMVIAHSPSYPTWGLQYQDSLDKFNFLSAGFPVMTIDLQFQRVSIGTRLGIGTVSPVFPLDVLAGQAVGRFTTTNSANGSVLQLDNSSSAVSYYGAINFQDGIGQIGYLTNNIMSFRTAGSERMRIDGNGNVGIGTPAPVESLHVFDIGNAGDILIENEYPFLKLKQSSAGNNAGFLFNDPSGYTAWLYYRGSDQAITMGSTTSGGSPDTLVLQRDGNVGVDTASAFAKLTVNGSLGFKNASTPAMYMYESGTANVEKPVIVHSPAFAQWGLWYADTNDSFVIKSSAVATPAMVVSVAGRWATIGSGTRAAGYALSVDGKIACEEILVQDSGSWPDYVFQEGYALKPLEEVEAHIKERKHLPGIPTAKEVAATGISIGDMQKRTMEKIEELTLYVIEQNKRLTAQEKLILELQAKLQETKP